MLMRKGRLHYFGKMLTVFTITILSTAVILSVFSYRQLTETLKEKTYADCQATLHKNAQTWEALYSEFSQLKQSIIVDPQVETFFYMSEYDPVMEYKTYLKVKKVFNINPFVDAICLYQATVDYRMYCGTDAFDVETLWQELKREDNPILVSEKREDTQEQILVLGYPIYVDSLSEPEGGIFLCINAKKVAEYIMGDMSYDQVILNENNEIMLYTGEYPDAEMMDWMQKHDSTANELFNMQQGRLICSIYKENGMKFVNFVQLSEVMTYIRNRELFFSLVCIVIATLSAALQTLAVKRIYRPIAMIRDEFEESKFAKGNAGSEFERIRQVHQEAVNQVTKMEEQKAEAQLKMKKDVLRGLLIGSLNPEHAEKRLAELGWSIPKGSCFLCSVQIDRKQEGKPDALVQDRVCQALEEKLSVLFCIESVRNGSDEIIVLITSPENSSVTFQDLIFTLQTIIDSVKEEMEISVTLGLDGLIEEISDCHEVYRRVKELQKNRFALGENQVIYSARIRDLLPEPFRMPEKLMHEIHVAFIKGDKEDYIEKVQSFLAVIKRYTYAASMPIFARLYLELIADIQKNIIDGRGDNVLPEMKMNPATMQEAEALLQNAFDVMMTRKAGQERIKENRHYKKIQEGREYIQKHYADGALGVEQLAGMLGYSSSYFSRIFKNITGYYVNDYIRQVRIVKAQELLIDTELTVNEIAEATGFTTGNYFYSIFKKETGMTPAAYRSSK